MGEIPQNSSDNFADVKNLKLLTVATALVLGLASCGGPGDTNNNGNGGNNGGNTDNSIPTAATAPQFKGMGLSGADIFVYTDVIARCTLDTVASNGATNSVVMTRTAQSNPVNGRNFYHVGTASGSFKKISFTCVNSAGSASHTIVGG